MKSRIYADGINSIALRPRSLGQGRWRAGLLALVLVVAAGGSASARSSSEFSSLSKNLHQRVTVETTEGQQVTGDLVRVEENRIMVYEAGTPKPIARESVKKVTKHKSRHTAAWIAGMSAAGLGAGFLIGLSAFDDAINANRKVGAAALAGAGSGAVAGFGLSRVGKRENVIYESH